MSVIELLASKTIDHKGNIDMSDSPLSPTKTINREAYEMTPEEDARAEHAADLEEAEEVICRIEWLMKSAMNAGLSAAGPEVGALKSIIDSYRVTATMVAARILEKKLEKLQ